MGCAWGCRQRPEYAPLVQTPAQGLGGLHRLGAQVALCRSRACERSTGRDCHWARAHCREKHTGLALVMQRRDASLMEGIGRTTDLLQFPFPFCSPPDVPRAKSGGHSACSTPSVGAVKPGRVLGRRNPIP